MKALSVKPRWAALIAAGTKTLEIRSRRTHHRGPLLICATQPDGIAKCVVEVTDCRPFEPEDADAACVPWSPGLWAWQLANPRGVAPLPVRGQQGIFHVDLEASRPARPIQSQPPLPFAQGR